MIDHTYDFFRSTSLASNLSAPVSRMATWALSLMLVTGIVFASKVALAAPVVEAYVVEVAPPKTFAQPGQIFVSLGTESLLQGIWASGFEKTFSVQLEPVVGYFFTEHLFARLGFEMQLDQLPKAAQDVGDLRTFALGVAPGIGAAWRLHPKVTIAPTLGVGLGRVWRSVKFSGYRSTVDIQASVPFVFDFVENVSFFVAPSYKQLVFNRETFPERSRSATLGGSLGVGMGALAYW